MDFDPDSPINIAAAHTEQAIHGAQAHAIEGDTLPYPPNGLPPLRSIPGTGFDGAQVLGYAVKQTTVRDCIRPDGSHATSSDPGFFEATLGRLKAAPMPKGWMFEERQATRLYALVKGNSILLEGPARRLGYSRATACNPQWLDLGEIEP